MAPSSLTPRPKSPQNRILNTSVLIAPGARVVLPVSCVEHGRWAERPATFHSEERMYSSSPRSRKMRSVSEALLQTGTYDACQGEVWADVASESERLGSFSATEAMADSHREYGDDIERTVRTFKRRAGQVGCLGLLGEQVLSLDALAGPELFQRMHDKLIRSYAADALRREAKERPAEVRKIAARFLGSLGQLKLTRHPSVGQGTDLRFRNNEVRGSALVHEAHVVHLSMFPQRSIADGEAERVAGRRH